MNMKPIIFSTTMVQAILEGRKTQTRRVIKPQPLDEFKFCVNTGGVPTIMLPYSCIVSRIWRSDILYVREKWTTECGMLTNALDGKKIHYCADCKEDTTGLFLPCKWKKRPSIHMKRENARIFLRVTDVRCERLRDISGEDAAEEGTPLEWSDELPKPSYHSLAYNEMCVKPAMIKAFSELWDSLNAKRGYGWDVNPWVWVYEFERCEKDGGDE